MKLCGFGAALVVGVGVVGAFATGATAQDDNVFKLGFVAFISGPPAESAGKPSVQGAKTVIDGLNAGSLPKPYDKVGFGGLKIQVQLPQPERERGFEGFGGKRGADGNSRGRFFLVERH